MVIVVADPSRVPAADPHDPPAAPVDELHDVRLAPSAGQGLVEQHDRHRWVHAPSGNEEPLALADIRRVLAPECVLRADPFDRVADELGLQSSLRRLHARDAAGALSGTAATNQCRSS